MRQVIGFLTGIGAGVGVGLLLAPRSGKRTLSLIRRRANGGADYLRQESTVIRDAATEAIRDGTRKIVMGAEALRAALG